ncbi:DUF2304 domain-containing protein [Corynebacterium pseudodiphtheriticum]|uniref:DUF2304 domain-containing protein n=1 Tax=Corynebacterium pseudodiphtheriticum TaxID=37637 RepID=UPI00254D9B4A|nr:DUF2304 domain-containing protein [Corynebacterium pseudodiphtheriticum]MDK8478477.1 DUF2304 domain-containing protein [Corynebacterium pseudodiphtheriticum]MDK8486930.1 DUF2304 domain-containing protein [Corynebacterium pseudodiphtheriticum]MDK8494058.1 DUF2304 domain-containing protein [Corynebacterium pseudodiphtheriticum]MDK8552477.1 DUF2304 domain-containing protein [Corynebacterium pseudodiphtheriticum]
MLLIQILLVIAVAALTLYFLSNRRKARAKAGVKIGFVTFLILAIFAVLFPDATTWVAQLVGVQRGTDLMLYALIVAFVFVTVSSYLRFREQELRFARLARAVALSNAQAPDDLNDADDLKGADNADNAEPTGARENRA